ncbi:MAG: ABC transporter permease [Candidatus Hydrogenedentota bacterium]|nr:MAG: ABC transporter permease [Candidatus Hydrogenedentota bacterium]
MTKTDRFGLFLAGFLVLFVIFFCAGAPIFTRYPADGATATTTSGMLEARHLPPSLEHPFGTDELGRDVFARSLYGGRISLAIGVLSRLLAVAIGGLLGLFAGFFKGKFDIVLSRVIEVVLAFPSLILAIAIGVALGPGLKTVVIAIVAVSWVDVAVLTRAIAAQVSEQDFVLGARALGESTTGILFRHVLPNCLPVLLVAFSFGIASAVMVEASLSFLGLGISSGGDLPSWGWMIYTAQYHLAAAPWAVFGPGLLLSVTVLGWNLLGDVLRDILDVRRVGS